MGGQSAVPGSHSPNTDSGEKVGTSPETPQTATDGIRAVNSEDRTAITSGFLRIINEGGYNRDILSIADVIPAELVKVAKRIMKDQFGPIRAFRMDEYTQDEIEAEVSTWVRNNKTRPCMWPECGKESAPGYSYCQKHRTEINDIARMIG